jgi:hypothetical protein
MGSVCDLDSALLLVPTALLRPGNYGKMATSPLFVLRPESVWHSDREGWDRWPCWQPNSMSRRCGYS